MAILIRKNLTASPNPTTLPKRIELSQTLRSTLPEEPITVVYQLAPGHQIWFKDGDNPPAKSFSRPETVGTTDQICRDRVELVIGPGTGPIELVQIDQTITDSFGIPQPDLVLVQIQSA
ncbi:MAG TPA: hypothetical protein VGS22_14680 [Thermoanaerobaculia bacterium]|jgi:hypothetical protein|nr:hypothetical protein [Thermoanaerobaculia bacterium]